MAAVDLGFLSRCERSSLPRRISDRRLCDTSRHKKAVRSGAGRIAWQSLKLLRNIAGSNNGETQPLAFANENLWFARHAWSKMHGASLQRWHLDDAVRQVGGMLTTHSRGIFEALTRSECPQLRLRSARTGEEAHDIKEQCSLSLKRATME